MKHAVMHDVLARYDYALPPTAVAHVPASPRDAARLLTYERATGRTTFAAFRDLPRLLPRGAVLVVNDTKVLPVRLVVRKPSGGMVRLLILGTGPGRRVRALADRALSPGMALSVVGASRASLTVVRREGAAWVCAPSFPLKELRKLLLRRGQTPIPPYIKNTPLSERVLRKKYQSVFAVHEGSSAAPTASLHFTPRLLAALSRAGVTVCHLTLHVGLGTFAPLTESALATGKLHAESYAIPQATARAILRARAKGHPVIAVGTTVLRALESSADAQGRIVRPRGETQLFIREGYRFRVVTGLVTNFHVPRSSLLMLVAAFAGRDEVLRLYRTALRHTFKFFSFGDGMLIT